MKSRRKCEVCGARDRINTTVGALLREETIANYDRKKKDIYANVYPVQDILSDFDDVEFPQVFGTDSTLARRRFLFRM